MYHTHTHTHTRAHTHTHTHTHACTHVRTHTHTHTHTWTGLSGLRELSLDNTVITDEGIKYIAGTYAGVFNIRTNTRE